MQKWTILSAFAAVAISLSPSVASECTSTSDVNALRARWATVRSQPVSSVNTKEACRAFATSLYESVVVRLTATMCPHNVSKQRTLALLDSDINAFNDLLAAKCGN